MKKYLLFPALAVVLVVAAHFGCSFAQPRPRVPVLPPGDALFTSTRSVASLALDRSGALWAATSGGVLRRSPAGAWTKYSRLEGLPSDEVRRVSLNEKGEVEVLLPRTKATWQGEKWVIEKAGLPPNAPQSIDAEWNDQVVQAAPGTFRSRPKNSMAWTDIELPKNSRVSHVSALLVQDGVLWCALYGDGLWSYDGESWKKLDIALPDDAREITALAFDAKTKTLWLGTRRDGIWQYSLSGWHQHLQSDEPFDHNAQCLQMFKGELWMSTLDDGLQVCGEDGWRVYDAPTISSNAPRHLVEFQNQLFVRHGDGKVDVFDGQNWKRDVFSKELPRKKAFALATDHRKLYVAQWGGWSEWDGKSWTHFLKIPELQGLPLMCLLPDGDKLWIGTQSRGLAEYSHATGQLKWHDERAGLPDDWITCLAKIKGEIFAGTFVGGLAIWNEKNWRTVKPLAGDNVTDLKADGQGGVLIATRRGVWRRDGKGVLVSLNDQAQWLDTETQALCVTPEGVWVGARTGLFWLRQ
jgi:ligand-binding sensor domain-containing protein